MQLSDMTRTLRAKAYRLALYLLFCALPLIAFPSVAFAAPEGAQRTSSFESAAEYQQRRIDFDISPYEDDLQRVQDYLNNLTTLESRFTQTTAQTSGLNMGKVYISKPGKARWEYKVPTPRLVIVNEDELIYYDVELNEVTYGETPTPLTLFLSDEFDVMDESIRILDVTRGSNTLTVALTPADNVQGETLRYEALILTFGLNPIELVRIQTIDQNNNAITLELVRPKFGKKLDDALFVFKDPRPLRERRNIP